MSVCHQPIKLLLSLFARTNSPSGKPALESTAIQWTDCIMDSVEFALPRPRETSTTEYSPFSTWRFFSREQVKSECDWMVMSSVFVASQSSCFFPCLREQIRQVENRLKVFLCDIVGAADKDNELSKARGDASVKVDDIAKIMAAGAHANVKYTRPGAGRNENDGQSLMKKKQKHDSALCLGKAQECLL